MNSKTVLRLVTEQPGLTSHELAKLSPGDKGKDKPMMMNCMLRNLAARNLINRIRAPGINPKVRAFRHYPVLPVIVGDGTRYGEPLTIRLLTPREMLPDGLPPVTFPEFVAWLAPHAKGKLSNLGLRDTDFADFVIANLPRLKPDEIKRILVAAAAQRLSA